MGTAAVKLQQKHICL